MNFPVQVHLALHTSAPADGEATEVTGSEYRRQPLEMQGSGQVVFEVPPLDPKRVYKGLWTAENGGTLLASVEITEGSFDAES